MGDTSRGPKGLEPMGPVDLRAPLAIETQEREAEPRGAGTGIALCLSGSGYRAMLFHLGSLWRLNEAGLLPKLDRVSSVSGGSITAGRLGMVWSRLDFDANGVATNFEALVAEPLLALATESLSLRHLLSGAVVAGSAAKNLSAFLEKHLFGEATLQDLPDDAEGPRFVISATNLQTGALWRFSRPYMADWRQGRVDSPTISLAQAVTASSAIPPIFSPAVIRVDGDAYAPDSTDAAMAHLQQSGRVYLTDGSVYDKLGLESAYQRCTTLLVSDAARTLELDESVARDTLRHSIRILAITDGQVRALRRRQLVDAFERGEREGALWTITASVYDYGLEDPVDADPEIVARLAATSTMFRKLNRKTREGLVNWGYAICDAALRKFVDPSLPRPDSLPLPKTRLT